jgi:two-component system nitrogen regulation sensor histidine kinase GlnL
VGVRGALRDDGALVIDVWDEGPGVPADRVGTLFHRWVTSRAHEGGTGLGLSVAQSLVTDFGWTIEYVREPARTCFRVTVPPEKVCPPRGE